MSQPARKKRIRKAEKKKDEPSRQTSLLDVFGIKPPKKNSSNVNLSAANSENESVGTDEIIEIFSSDAEPMSETSNVIADSSNTRTTVDGGRGTALAAAGKAASGSKDIPIIVLDSSSTPASPVRAVKSLPRNPPKALYSIFSPRKQPGARMSSPKPHYRGSPTPLVPFPDSAMQHVRGPQSIFFVPSSQTLRLVRQVVPDASEGHGYSRLPRTAPHNLGAANTLPPSSHLAALGTATRERGISSIPTTHRTYPSIRRLVDEQPECVDDSTVAHLLWTDKWRPRRADQVLGNERSALYLRDWLLALKLHISTSQDVDAQSTDLKGKQRASKSAKKKGKEPRGTKRPRIVRDVQKKRRRIDSEEPEDPWMADDSTDDEPPLDVVLESEGDFFPANLPRLKRADTEDSLEKPPSSPPEPSQDNELITTPLDDIPSFSYTPPKFGDAVYNTILLTGPHGCGKTAAVYACAEELGWDVFEVYPGIGERSGVALNKLIGESVKSTRPKANFFAKRVVSDDEAEDAPTPIIAPAEELVEQTVAETTCTVNQSIVLVEEVDLLYKEDANFWPALQKIIKECRRPMVLTCNDVSLVPLGELPLQTTLPFIPCPTSLASSYLQALCLAESYNTSREELGALYENPGGPSEERAADLALHPEYAHLPGPDLRRAINQLQVGCASGDESISEVPASIEQSDQSLEALARLAKGISLSSFLDARLHRPREEVLRDLLLNSASPSADDELGFKHLVADAYDLDSNLPITFSTYHRDESILCELLSFAQTCHPSLEELLSDTPHLHLLHAAHCGAILPALDGLHVPREQLVRDAQSVFLDYEPWIRHMVRVDDVRVEQTLASGKLEGTRRTRNSQRSQLELDRWIFLGDPELETLRRTAFGVDLPGSAEMPIV
ncbi:hypothetical protein C8Q79DRAFT_691863 [Trametes meyenii]|nr:hypothetical protein C8Q79DRAFT_691863 [Trametes meyenii]